MRKQRELQGLRETGAALQTNARKLPPGPRQTTSRYCQISCASRHFASYGENLESVSLYEFAGLRQNERGQLANAVLVLVFAALMLVVGQLYIQNRSEKPAATAVRTTMVPWD